MSHLTTPATLSNNPQRLDHYDCIVIGAGVSGGLSAYALAKAGYSVLLVDAKPFPREKVCGSCLNQRGQRVLERAGLLPAFQELGGAPIEEMQLMLHGSKHRWEIPRMISTRRSALDSMLVSHAKSHGATFLDQTRASVLPEIVSDQSESRLVELRSVNNQVSQVSAKLILVADGLTQSSLSRLPEFQSHVNQDARIGVQAIADIASIPTELRDRLTMVVGSQGYVGLAPVDGQAFDIAAAIDPDLVSKGQRPWHLVNEILLANQIEIDSTVLSNLQWLATPPLTRRSSRCGANRLLLLGDSLGYVEPFTGEGMSWALRSAELVQKIAPDAIACWQAGLVDAWQKTLQKQLIHKQWFCTQFAQLLRQPRRAKVLARVCDTFPSVRNWAMQKVSVS